MIRTGLPIPTWLQIRLRAQIAANRFARQARSIRAKISEHIATIHRHPIPSIHHQTANEHLSSSFKEDVCLTSLLADFEDKYQQLVDLLCWSAKDGLHDGRDEEYAVLREWFLSHYEFVRPLLLQHLQPEPEDTEPIYACERAPRDAFETLFLPENLDAIINSDSVISRISRTRCAVECYRDEIDKAS